MLPQAAVSIVRVREPEPSILIMERSAHPKDPWSGHLCFPGGRVESSDADALDTAIRETSEELGLTLRREQCVEICPHGEAGHYSGRVTRVAIFAFELKSRPTLRFNPSECQAAYWLKESDFIQTSDHHQACFHPKNPRRSFPFVWVQKRRLWGFTYEELLKFYIRREKIEQI